MKTQQGNPTLISAGGVVYRVKHGSIEIIVCGRSSPSIWALPKGTPVKGETIEQTALRETKEETGLDVKIQSFVKSIKYSFLMKGTGLRPNKTVHFYLMTPVGGDVSLHDHEFDIVKWLPVEVALETLSYKNEVGVVEESLSMVQ